MFQKAKMHCSPIFHDCTSFRMLLIILCFLSVKYPALGQSRETSNVSDDFRPSRNLGPIVWGSPPTIWESPPTLLVTRTGKQLLPVSTSIETFAPKPREFIISDQLLTPAAPTIFRQIPNGTRKQPKEIRRRQGTRQAANCAGATGECTNLVSCLFSGSRMDWTESGRSCSGIMNVCCVGSPAARKREGFPLSGRRRPGKSGRSLFGPPQSPPNVVQYFTSVVSPDVQDFVQNSIESGNTNQWHLYSVPTSKDATCGFSKNAQSKIMGGLDAGYGQFPWTAHIKIKGPDFDKVCGGTLVNRRWVVTAGHCTQYCQDYPECRNEVSQYSIQYKVILGEYDQQSNVEEYPPDSYLAVEVIRHPNYENIVRYHVDGVLESEPRYDLALLMLDRPARLAPSVAPICLPPLKLESYDLTSPGTLGTVVGWGRLGRDEDAPHSSVLQAVTVPILGDKDCAFQTGLSVYPDQMCAGGTDVDQSACPGDSGGALQVRDANGKWVLVGVVSNGPSTCGLQPVVFHKIEKTLPWIVRTMGERLIFP